MVTPVTTTTDDTLASNVWVELIAFDVTAPDLGVAAYLSDLGHRPKRLSLLLYSLQFLHSHVPGDDSALLPVECTSYGARPWSARGPRQDWTQGDLRRLIALLAADGVGVHFALFDLCGYRHEGEHRISRFSLERPELTVVDARGQRRDGMINPLRTLSDGTPYTTVILSLARSVVEYYAFAGWHIADGLSSTRLALWEGDFGVARVADFAAAHPGLIDPSLLVDDTPAQVAARAAAVWADARIEWIRFHAERFAAFWAAASALMAELGAEVIMNNAWTRDPFEALYRYGADYSRVEPAGVAVLVMESSAAAVELLDRPACPPLLGMVGATMLARTHMSNLIALIGVHDVYEGWDVIGHAPAMLQRDLWALTASGLATDDGVRRCLDGVLWCLADGVRPEQWRWLLDQRRLIGPGQTAAEPAVTLLYDPATLWRELAAFPAERAATTQRWLTLLLRAGADLCRIATFDTPLPPEAPVILLRADLYSQQQRDIVRRHRHHALISWDDEQRWQVSLSGDPGALHESSHPAGAGGTETPDNGTWIVELPMAEPEEATVDLVAGWVNQWSPIDAGSVVRLTRRRTADSQEVTMVNTEHAYVSTLLRGRTVADVEVVTRDAAVIRSATDGARVQMPPLGASTIRLRGSRPAADASTGAGS